jgi:hypothetical protein
METITVYVSQPEPTFSTATVSYKDILNHPERYYQVIILMFYRLIPTAQLTLSI